MNEIKPKTAALALAFCALGSIAACTFAGCVYKGAKITEGTDLAVGLNVPVSEGTLQFQALNYLGGFRLGVDRNAILRCKYTVAETNSYFGCVSTQTAKTVDAEVIPLPETGNAATNAAPVANAAPTNAPAAVTNAPLAAVASATATNAPLASAASATNAAPTNAPVAVQN